MTRKNKFTKCNLAQLLKHNKVTFEVMGEHLGVSLQQVQKYATGVNEMSLIALLKACQLLNCSPKDIYPEIEIYDKGFNIPKTQPEVQGEQEAKVVNITNNYYSKSNPVSDFFSNIRIMDLNSKAALLLKIAVFIIVLDNLLYTVFRMFGQSYSLFFSEGDHLSQLMSAWIINTWPLSFVLPLIVRHWLVYIITLYTFKGMLDILGEYVFMFGQHNVIDGQTFWIIKTFIALLFTLGYAYLVKKYLRSNNNSVSKDTAKN